MPRDNTRAQSREGRYPLARPRFPKRLLCLGFAIISVLAACSDDPEPDSGAPATVAEEIPTPVEDAVITNTVIVDPQIVEPSNVVLNPADPSELWVQFVHGDPLCTAAQVDVLEQSAQSIAIELRVGASQDAATRTCANGQFNLRVNAQLNESAVGKQITWSLPPVQAAPAVTPELTTDDFVGIPQPEAIDLADENLVPWRIGRIDDEVQPLLDDVNPNRLTFEIDEGIVSAATLG